jgi:hypothetical protein
MESSKPRSEVAPAACFVQFQGTRYYQIKCANYSKIDVMRSFLSCDIYQYTWYDGPVLCFAATSIFNATPVDSFLLLQNV